MGHAAVGGGVHRSIFSTGIPLTLLGIERLAGAFGQAGLETYSDATLADADRTAGFVAGSYAGFRRFPQFAAYSMFYFAAASYSEMARRLSRRARRAVFCAATATHSRVRWRGCHQR